MTPYTDGQQTPDPPPDPPEHEQLRLATNGLDGNGDLLPWRRVLCRLRGHQWEWHDLVYSGCWTNDERCRRCGMESWWPT